jgi:hypothetical protein
VLATAGLALVIYGDRPRRGARLRLDGDAGVLAAGALVLAGFVLLAFLVGAALVLAAALACGAWLRNRDVPRTAPAGSASH